jgi:methylated-DNA-[protein]-cysteine S-methyltransferase
MNALARLDFAVTNSAVHVARVASPLGDIHIASVVDGVCAAVFDDRAEGLEPRLRRAFGPFFHVERGDCFGAAACLAAYFAGDFDALRAVPLAPVATPMQRRVWAMVFSLPPGSLTTYAVLAARLGMPRGQRAVGVCLATNPLPLFIPCHRVVSTSGGLASHPGGVVRKRWLLRHEGALVEDPTQRAAPRTARVRLDPRDRVELVRLPRVANG